ncbi:MAG: class I SAM-dependent methyltransferase [Streptosporangiaceae bacterium]
MTGSIPPRAEGFYDPRTYGWEIGTSDSRSQRRRFYPGQTVHPGARVLELGCGTGEISLALARRGANVVGLDSSPDMIAAACAKARQQGCSGVSWVRAYMEAFAFRTHFTAVIVPYHALFHVLSHAELDALLTRVHAHLEPGGVFLADVFTRAPGSPSQRRTAAVTPNPDGTYHVHEDERFDPATGRLRSRFTYRLEDAGSGRTLDIWTRRLDYLVTAPDVLAARLRGAGFRDVTAFEAFDTSAPVAPGRDAVLRGRAS